MDLQNHPVVSREEWLEIRLGVLRGLRFQLRLQLRLRRLGLTRRNRRRQSHLQLRKIRQPKKNSPASASFIATPPATSSTPTPPTPAASTCWSAPTTTSTSRQRGVTKKKSWNGCGITINMPKRPRPFAVMGTVERALRRVGDRCCPAWVSTGSLEIHRS